MRRPCVHIRKIIQGRKDAGLTTYCFFLDVQKAYDTSMEKLVVAKGVGNWDHRKDVENDEKYGGMCERCCDAGRGNIMLILYNDLHRDVHYHPICSRYILMI